MPIYDIRVLRRRVSLGILRSEALPNRSDHLGEPVYSQLFSAQQATLSLGKAREKMMNGNERNLISP